VIVSQLNHLLSLGAVCLVALGAVLLLLRFSGRAASGLEDALKIFPAPRLITGSLYLVGAALAANGELPN